MEDPASKSSAAAPPADEFAGIPSPKTRHPALALGVVALAAFLVFHVRSDLAYALSSSRVTDLGQAGAVFAASPAAAVRANRYVRIAGVPDRQGALHVDTQGSWQFSQLFRILGTEGRLYLHREKGPLPADLAERDVFQGRLIRFRDLSFQSAIRRYFVGHVSATHFFELDTLRSALGKPAATVRDVAGDAVTLREGDVLAIDVARTDELRVALPRTLFAEEAAARAEIERRGGTVLGPAPGDPSKTHHGFRVVFPAERRMAALADLGDLDRRVDIRIARESHRVRLSDLKDTGDALTAGTLRVPSGEVQAIRTMAPVEIPDDAFLLIEGDVPRDHATVVVVAALLVLFAGVNLAGLRRGLKAA